MSALKKNHKNKIPQWQSDRMKSLIEERWSEVWRIAIAREQSNQKHDYFPNLRQN